MSTQKETRRIDRDYVHEGVIYAADRDERGQMVPTLVEVPAHVTFGEPLVAPPTPLAVAGGGTTMPAGGGLSPDHPTAPPREAFGSLIPAASSETSRETSGEPSTSPTPSTSAGAEAGTESSAESTGGSAGGSAGPSVYDELDRLELLALVQQRGLDAKGTGANGNVLKRDLVAALEAADAGAQG